MLEEKYDLPVDWSWKTIAEVIEHAQPGFASGSKGVKGGIRHLRMNNIGADCRLNLDSVLTVPQELARPRHILQHSDVLVCHTNSVKLVGKTAIFDIDDGPYAFSNHLTRLRVNLNIIDPRWLWHVLSTLWRGRYFENRCKQWVNQATIERETLLSAPVPLPPLPEQQRIVEKIEHLFAESRTAREALEQIPILLKRFRQAVLAKAFRGELTERDPNDEPVSVLLERIRAERRHKWEESTGTKGKKQMEPELPDTSDLPKLPERWCWATLETCTHLITKGESPNWQGFDYVKKGVPFIRSENVLWGKLDYAEAVKIPADFHKKLKRSQLQPKDVLINLVGASIGRCGIMPDEIEAANINQAVAAIRTNQALIPDYLMHFFISPDAQDVLQDKKVEVARANISLGDLRQLFIPLSPLAEQRRIVAKIESLFAQAEAIEQAVAVAQKRAEKVDQAILAKAFRGELVKAGEAATVETAVVIPSLPYSILDLRHAVTAYIINVMYDIETFGRVQLQKALYLIETWVGLLLQGNYQRARLGPFDDEMLSEIENTAQQAASFFRHDRPKTKGYYYVPGPAMDKQLQVANSLLGARKEKLNQLLKLFRKLNTEKAEMAATLFAAWNDFLLDGIKPTDEQIIHEVRENWHEKKKRFSPEQLQKMLGWMRQYGLTPTGTGPRTQKSNWK